MKTPVNSKAAAGRYEPDIGIPSIFRQRRPLEPPSGPRFASRRARSSPARRSIPPPLEARDIGTANCGAKPILSR